MDDDVRELAKLGRAIRKARGRRGLSERGVAVAVRGVSLAGVRAIEAGKRARLNYGEIIRLARALGVEPGSLFVRAESPSVEDDARDWRLGLDGLADRKMTAEAPRSA